MASAAVRAGCSPAWMRPVPAAGEATGVARAKLMVPQAGSWNGGARGAWPSVNRRAAGCSLNTPRTAAPWLSRSRSSQRSLGCPEWLCSRSCRSDLGLDRPCLSRLASVSVYACGNPIDRPTVAGQPHEPMRPAWRDACVPVQVREEVAPGIGRDDPVKVRGCRRKARGADAESVVSICGAALELSRHLLPPAIDTREPIVHVVLDRPHQPRPGPAPLLRRASRHVDLVTRRGRHPIFACARRSPHEPTPHSSGEVHEDSIRRRSAGSWH